MNIFRAIASRTLAHFNKTSVFVLCLLLPTFPAMAVDAEATTPKLSAQDRIKSCNPSIAIPAALEILNDPESLKEPITLFAPVIALFQHGQRDDAVFWFYAARLRTMYQLEFEKGDRAQLLGVMTMTTGQLVNSYALQDIDSFIKTLDRVLEWDKKTGNPFRDRAKTEKIESEITKIYDGFQDLKAKLILGKEKYEAQARKSAPEMERMYTGTFKSQCREGQIDPAYAAQESKKEWERVIDFARNNPDVIREAGKVIDAFAVSSTRNSSTEVMPSRYEVAVKGINGKSVYAIIDVSRTTNPASFTLACTTRTSLGNRDVRKNACFQ